MAKARTLVLNTKVNVTGADKLRGLGRTLQQTGGLLTAGLTLPILGIGGAMLTAAQDAEKAQAKLKNTFDSMGAAAFTSVDALNAHAAALQDATTFDDEAINEAQAVLLTFGNVTGDAFTRATEAALDMTSLFEGDLQSATIQIGKALNDPIKGITALTRVGVSFTDQQKEQIKTLAESGDVLGAQTIILAELERQFGGTAEALAGTTGGQMTQAMNQLGEASEQFGAIIAPVLVDVARGLKDFAKWLQQLNPETREWVVRIGALAAALGPVLVLVGSMLRVLGPLAKVIGPLAAKLKVLSTALGVSRLAMLGWIGVIGAAGIAVGQQYGEVLEGLSGQILRDFAKAHGIAADEVATDVARIAESLGVDIPEAQKRLLAGMDGVAEDYDITVRGLTDSTNAATGEISEALLSSEAAWEDYQNQISGAMVAAEEAVSTGAKNMGIAAGKAPGLMADQMLANQFVLTGEEGAIAELVRFMEQALTPAQEMFNAQAFLDSQEFKDGMASGTPSVVRKTEELRDEALAVLATGDASSGGKALIRSWTKGMDDQFNADLGKVWGFAGKVKRILGGSLPTEGPLKGGLGSGGVSIAESWLEGIFGTLGAGMPQMDRILGGVSSAFSPSLTPAVGGSAGVVNNFYLQWDGEPPKGRNEEEIIGNLQRLSPLVGNALVGGT